MTTVFLMDINFHSYTLQVSLTLRNRSSHQRYFVKNGVFKNFAKFTEKHLCWSLFFKKRLQHRRFPVNFSQLLRTFFYRIPLGDYCPSQSVSKVREKDLSILLVSLLAEEIIILLHNQASMTFCNFSILSVSC